MSTPSQIIQQMLIDLGVAAHPQDAEYPDWPVFFSNEPENPNECLTLYDTEGITHGRINVNGEVPEHYGFQLRCRSLIAQEGYDKLKQITDKLDTEVMVRSVTILDDEGTGGVTYTVRSANRRGQIRSLGKDPSNGDRFIHTVNYIFTM